MKTTLINLAGDEDLLYEAYEELEVHMLQYVYARGDEVTVTACAVKMGGKKADDYYDIQLANGLRFEAISGKYLEGIEKWNEQFVESQFVLTVRHCEHKEVQTMLSHEINEALKELRGIASHELQYETTYPVNR